MESNEPATAENRDFHCFDAAGSAGSLLTKRSIMALGRGHTIVVKCKIRVHRSRCRGVVEDFGYDVTDDVNALLVPTK